MDYVNALKAPARNGWRRTVFDYVGMNQTSRKKKERSFFFIQDAKHVLQDAV